MKKFITTLLILILSFVSWVKADKQLQPNTIAIGHDAPDFQVELLGSKLLKLSDHVKKCEGPTILLFARAHW